MKIIIPYLFYSVRTHDTGRRIEIKTILQNEGNCSHFIIFLILPALLPLSSKTFNKFYTFLYLSLSSQKAVFYNIFDLQINFFFSTEGNVKLKMSDQSTIIANFQGSTMNGLRREWDVNGNLTFIGHRYRDAPVGHCWYLQHHWIVMQILIIYLRQTWLL